MWQISLSKDDHNNISHLTGSSTMWPCHTHQKVESNTCLPSLNIWTLSMTESTRSDTELSKSGPTGQCHFHFVCLNLALVTPHFAVKRLITLTLPTSEATCHCPGQLPALKWTNWTSSQFGLLDDSSSSQHLTTTAWVTSRQNYPDESCSHKFWAQ